MFIIVIATRVSCFVRIFLIILGYWIASHFMSTSSENDILSKMSFPQLCILVFHPYILRLISLYNISLYQFTSWPELGSCFLIVTTSFSAYLMFIICDVSTAWCVRLYSWLAGLDGNLARQSQDEVFWRREQDGHGPFCLSLSYTPYLYVLTKLKIPKHGFEDGIVCQHFNVCISNLL